MKKLLAVLIALLATACIACADDIIYALKPEPTHAEIVALYNSLNWEDK